MIEKSSEGFFQVSISLAIIVQISDNNKSYLPA